jgi:quercetin dioxygenase-like cupin family protein
MFVVSASGSTDTDHSRTLQSVHTLYREDTTPMNAGISTPLASPAPGFDRTRIVTGPGDLIVAELIIQRGHEPPLHRFQGHDLLVCVIGGDLTFQVNGHVHPAAPGAIVRLPRGTEHGFTIESETAQLVVIVTPAGPESYFALLYGGESARDLVTGLRPCATLDMLVAAAAHHDIEITGPKPQVPCPQAAITVQ